MNNSGVIAEMQKLGIRLVYYPRWLVCVCRGGEYKNYDCFTWSRARALDFVFLKYGYGRNEIVFCREMQSPEAGLLQGD